MQELEIQKYLRSGNTLESLALDYGIKATRHGKYPQLVGLKYNQIDSPAAHPLVVECRGIVLDESDNWRVIGRGFDRFFNYGDGNAAEIDWSTARVQEKVDGSLIMLYEYDGQGQVASSGTPDASGRVDSNGFSFAELFRRTVGDLCDIYDDCTDLCYIFELCSPYNRVVVPHTETKVTLLAIRDRRTGEYLNGWMTDIQSVREFPLASFEDVIASFEHIDGMRQEGYVVVDAAGNRVKVKHPQYVALHHMKENCGPKWFAKAVVSGEVDEIIAVFPEYKDELDVMVQKYIDVATEAIDIYLRFRDLESQKDFALAVKNYPFSGCMFTLRKREQAGEEVSVKGWFAEERNFAQV